VAFGELPVALEAVADPRLDAQDVAAARPSVPLDVGEQAGAVAAAPVVGVDPCSTWASWTLSRVLPVRIDSPTIRPSAKAPKPSNISPVAEVSIAIASSRE
jgi:hypothetical protein